MYTLSLTKELMHTINFSPIIIKGIKSIGHASVANVTINIYGRSDGMNTLYFSGSIGREIHGDILSYILAPSIINKIDLDYIGPWDEKSTLKIFKLWLRWNKNDCRYGTGRQEAFLRSHFKGKQYAYIEAVDALRAVNLLEVQGHRYGTKKLCEPIPSSVMLDILNIPKMSSRISHKINPKRNLSLGGST